MINTNEIDRSVPLATTVKPCPFCGNRGAVTQADDPPKFGVRCVGCPVCLLETFQGIGEAVAAWCQRRGTVSAAGGRATKGKLSWKKRRSCRRNLRIGRRKQKKKRIIKHIEAILPQLKALRDIEFAELQAAREKDRVWLQQVEPLIPKGHKLRPLWELVMSYKQRAEADDGQQADASQPRHDT